MSDPRNEPIRELLVLAIAAVGLMATVAWMVFLVSGSSWFGASGFKWPVSFFSTQPIEEVQMTSKAQYKGSTPKQRCEVCNGSFGLIRQRLAYKQFCSKHCLDQYLAKREQQPFA